jgi:hypothetical protein
MCYAYEEGSIFYNQQQKTLSDQGKTYKFFFIIFIG